MTPKFILTEFGHDDLSIAILEKAGIDPTMVRRMVIDFQAGSSARVFLEMFIDQETLNVELPEFGIKVYE